MNKKLIILSSVLLLAACNSNRDPETSQTTSPAPVTTDAFTLQVKAQTTTAPEDTDPQEISTVALQTPEDAEPVTVN